MNYKQSLKLQDQLVEASKEQMKNDKAIIKADVLTHYGKGKLACVRCGYNDVRALCLHHTNGDGYKEEKLNSQGKPYRLTAGNLYYILQIKGYPTGFETLCYNCHQVETISNPKKYGTMEVRGITRK